MKALIVDDEEEICFLIGHQLKKMGYESSQAHSLIDGIEQFDPAEHHLVFLDVHLPDGSGLDIIPILKAKNKRVKIIVISAHDSQCEHKKALELGASRFLGKPFSNKRIIDIMQDLN